MRVATSLGLALATIAGAAAAAPAPVIDNEWVSVVDVVLKPGETGPPTAEAADSVVMFLEGGRIRTTSSAGKRTLATRRFGDSVFVPKGTQARDTLVSGRPAHEIVLTLKDHPAIPPTPNRTGLPPAFPRAGSVKMLESDRFVVWRYTWKAGQPTPMHFHDKAVVVAYRYDGSLKSTTPNGETTVNQFKAGELRFNKPDRVHSELLVSPRESAVMIEFKQ